MGRGEKSLQCDPGSELRLGGRENARAKIINGMEKICTVSIYIWAYGIAPQKNCGNFLQTFFNFLSNIQRSRRPISFIRIKHRTRANDNLCKYLMYHAASKVEFQPFHTVVLTADVFQLFIKKRRTW